MITKRVLSLLSSCSLCTITALSQSLNPTLKDSRPNIILFMVDDMGWQDTSLPFWTERTVYNDVYETPNMERLAAKGMMFTQAYASSISSPTRCSLLTGANAARHRVTNWTAFKDKPTDIESEVLSLPEWNYNGVSQVEGTNNTFVATSFVDILKQSGYHTIHCGKAHFGAIDTPGANPHHFGFEVNISGHAAGGLASYLGENNFGHDATGKPWAFNSVPGLEKYWGTDTFVTEALTIEAIKSLEYAKKLNQPYFLYMAHYAIHIPIDVDKRFYQKYIDKGLTHKEAAYASLIEGMDKSLGDIMDWVEASGDAENTVIIFMSDNGGLSSAANWRDGELHTQNYPLNSGKGSAYEGGIREPMIVSWPSKVETNSKCDQYLIIEDFYPTILEMAGVKKYETKQVVDGVSFMPLLLQNGDPSKNRSLYWNYPNIWGLTGPGIAPTCTVREGDWKLIYYYETGKKELFNITNDISERNNLINVEVKMAKKLSSRLGRYMRRVGGQRPIFKESGEPCPWPDEI